jgi:adenosylmethionine---8-amino-7-oxononanoate aminotransferase
MVAAEELTELDRRLVWHPYGPMPASVAPLPVASADGVRLKLQDGRELIDGMASWWCAIHGYRHPVLDAAVRDQLEKMAHVMFGGLTHEGAVRLAERLARWTGMDHVFFADSGSVSVEVAIKLALQYWHGERTRLMTVRGGYHGDTFGAMAICDPDGGMHSMWKGVLPTHVFAPLPEWTPEWEQATRALAARHAHELAAIVVEPIVQGAGGMRFYAPECLRLLRELCDEHGMLLIFDEIATGFGRTGSLFAGTGFEPDVMCVGKALTGGYMTLAATLCRSHVAERVDGPLMHGPTFMANPLAVACALASTELLEQGSWQEDVARIERGLRKALPPEARVLGAIGVIELDAPVNMRRATRIAVDHGVWLRPFRNLIYCMPPYITSDEDVARIAAAMVACA